MLQEIRLKVKSGSLNANIDVQLQNFISLPTDKRNHETFANTLMHPKSFTSRHTSHGMKYESEAIHAYMKQMNSRSMPVQAFRSSLVVYKKEPVLACSPDGKVIDTGCTKPFGLLEVKCPETKFLVTPLEACSDPNFCCQNIDGKCKLKVTHPYYVQVQGQMGVTGAEWCDFVVFPKKACQLKELPLIVSTGMIWKESFCSTTMNILLILLLLKFF